MTEIIYGINPVSVVLAAQKRRVHEIYISESRTRSDIKQISDGAAKKRCPVKFLKKNELTDLAQTDKHQGIAARVDPYPFTELEEVLSDALKDEEKGFVVVLDEISDPQNLGAITRTAYLMGAHGIIIPKDKAASVTPSVVKASAGATEYIKIAQVTNIAQTISYIKDKGFWAFGAQGDSKESLYHHDFKGFNIVIVMGAEGRGIRRLVSEKCDHLISIPMKGKIGSFNVSVAAAIIMGEVSRQRLKSSEK